MCYKTIRWIRQISFIRLQMGRTKYNKCKTSFQITKLRIVQGSRQMSRSCILPNMLWQLWRGSTSPAKIEWTGEFRYSLLFLLGGAGNCELGTILWICGFKKYEIVQVSTEWNLDITIHFVLGASWCNSHQRFNAHFSRLFCQPYNLVMMLT